MKPIKKKECAGVFMLKNSSVCIQFYSYDKVGKKKAKVQVYDLLSNNSPAPSAKLM